MKRYHRPAFSGDGLDGTEDPREIDREIDADSYEPMPPSGGTPVQAKGNHRR